MVLDEPPDIKQQNSEHTVIAEHVAQDAWQPQDVVKVATQDTGKVPTDTTPVTFNSIQHMDLPGYWDVNSTDIARYQSDYYEYKGGGKGNVFLGIDLMHDNWYQDNEMPPERLALIKLMKESDHKLSDSEIKSIRNAFVAEDQVMPDEFDIQSAWTQRINGQRALFVEGRYKKDPNKNICTLSAYIDSNPKYPGTIPDSITYLADVGKDPEAFTKNLPMVMKALHSIQWRTAEEKRKQDEQFKKKQQEPDGQSREGKHTPGALIDLDN